MVALNEKNSKACRALLTYGIGVQVGGVMHGNIGSRARLDFTVISPAVNVSEPTAGAAGDARLRDSRAGTAGRGG